MTATINADGTTTIVSINKDTDGNSITTASQITDLSDRITTVVGERGLTTSYSNFTPAGHPLDIIQSDSTYTHTTLDSAARPTKVETYKADGTLVATVNTSYHPDGKVAAKWGTNTNPTYQLFDLQGRIVELRTYRSANLSLAPTATTPDYDATTWNYEPATGLLLSKRHADNKGPDYTYTPIGQLHTRTWARTFGESPFVTTYGYTPAGQLVSTDYNDTTPCVSITYDRLGRQLTQFNGLVQSTFIYDPATLALDQETISYNLDGQPGFEFSRVLDRRPTSLGRDTGWELKNGAAVENQTTYTYSPTDGRLWKIAGLASSDQGFVTPEFTYTHVPNGNLIDAVAGPIHTVDNVWKPDRDVLDIKENKVGITTVSKYNYTVNELGQRTTVSQTGTAFAAARGIILGYDALGQVTSADHSTDDNFDRAYQYDAIGNRIEARYGVATVTGTPNYTANALNQYIAVGSLSPVMDDDGNATSYPLPVAPTTNSTLAWDAENRLVEAQVGTSGPLVRNYYDAQSRRIARTVAGETTISLYDGWNCIAEYSTTNNSSINIHKSFLWGIDLSGSFQGAGGVGGLLAATIHDPQSTIYYPTDDGNGNVSEYLDSTGAATAHFEYDPFGNTVVNTDTAGQFAYRFSTKPIDHAAGIYYYGYRWYDPLTGRWPSRDPQGENGGIELYSINNNDSINKYDYLGWFNRDKKTSNECMERDYPDQYEQYLKDFDGGAKGHGDFFGSNIFNFNAPDDRAWQIKQKSGKNRDWMDEMQKHFQDHDAVLKNVNAAIDGCKFSEFQDSMHYLQDSYVHRGYRPSETPKDSGDGGVRYSEGAQRDGRTKHKCPCFDSNGIVRGGHLEDYYIPKKDQYTPDFNNAAWDDANRETMELVKKFLSKCPNLKETKHKIPK